MAKEKFERNKPHVTIGTKIVTLTTVNDVDRPGHRNTSRLPPYEPNRRRAEEKARVSHSTAPLV